ncbi:MFS transporter [Brucella melitensis]|uniref:MFS transporter n=1 Tax=Brucella melitensis TaxID=29459 RepID=UPI00112F4B21|nr:MFS transporter [Brucella melitensis]
MNITIEETLDQAGTGSFQRGLLGIFGLVWAADAMQVLAVGFTGAAIAKTFGLTVPQALQTGTLFFLGMLVGAALFGRLADKYGRRRILLITVACDALFGLLSAFAPDFGSLLALRFLTGLAVGGTLPVDYAMMAEFLPAKNRGRWLVMLEGFWTVGTVVIAIAAWATSVAGVEDAWRYIFIVTAAPALIGIWLRFRVPESPMQLLKSGRVEEAKAVINLVLSRNGKPELPPGAKLLAPRLVTNERLLSPNLRQRTLTSLAIWFLVSVSYYGIFTWIPAKLASDGFGFVRGYGFLVVVALAQLPGYALAAYGVEAWGRRKTLIGFLFVSAAACALFTVATSSSVVGASILIMSFALLGTWGALYAFTPELYPTALRASGMGAAGAMARLGGLLAPSAMAVVINQSFYTAVAMFAGLLALAGIIAFFINVETRQQALN